MDHQVHPLSLSIGLGAEQSAHFEFRPHTLPQCSPKLACELWVSIQNYVLWEAMMLENVGEKQPPRLLNRGFIFCGNDVATLLWPSVGVKPNTWKKLGLESSGTPENSEDDLEDQNTLYWGVLSVIGKVLKSRYRKWSRILDLNICSTSYGQKKGRESNWQFDSRPLKVGNRLAPDVRFGSSIRR